MEWDYEVTGFSATTVCSAVRTYELNEVLGRSLEAEFKR